MQISDLSQWNWRALGRAHKAAILPQEANVGSFAMTRSLLAGRTQARWPFAFVVLAVVPALAMAQLPDSLRAAYREDSECRALLQNLYRRSPRADSSIEWQRARRCVRDDDNRRRAAMFEIAQREMFRLGSIPMEIPEQHDEQRLMGTGGRLGPPAGIFASPFLAGFKHRWQVAAHPSPGALIGFVVVLREPGPVPTTYARLQLDYGLNCIFLLPALTPSGYQAWVKTQPGGAHCRTIGGTLKGPLEVKFDTTNIRESENVYAARFTEDLSDNNQPLLSLPCLESWCEIGPPGFTPHRPSAPPDPLDPDRPAHRVKGWHDEQDLEVMDLNTGAWTPSGIRGTIVPDGNLARRSDAMYRDVWLPVAKIYLNAAPAVTSKLHVRGLRQGWTKVELRNDVAGGSGWAFRMTPETNPLPAGQQPAIWRIAAIHRHEDAAVPATARWKYTLSDPGIWVMCGQYCCEADGTFF